MKNLLFTFLFCFLLSASTFAQRSINGKIVEIKDARTFVIEGNPKQFLTARLQYIEVPENGQPLYEVVKTHFAKLVLNKIARLEIRRTSLDNVLIGKLFIDETDISLQLLRDGAAWYDAPESASHNPNESQTYRETELTAKTEKRGIWSIPNMLPAWEFRAESEVKAQKEIAETKAKQEVIQAEKQRIRDEKAAKANLVEMKMPSIADVPVTAVSPLPQKKRKEETEEIEEESENRPILRISIQTTQATREEKTISKDNLEKARNIVASNSSLINKFNADLKNDGNIYYRLEKLPNILNDELNTFSRILTNRKNLETVAETQSALEDLALVFKYSREKEPVESEGIKGIANKYKVQPITAMNNEKYYLKKDLAIAVFGLVKRNYEFLRISLKDETVQ